MIKLTVEQGVFGKAPGARTDFRWLALSSQFNTRRLIERQSLLGAEDAPIRANAWQVSGSYCYAITMYPSRATDAAGRSGFLEKQFLQVHLPASMHAGLLALLLLPKVNALTDSIWWQQGQQPVWDDTKFSIALENFELEFTADSIFSIIDESIQQLKTAFKSKQLDYQVFTQGFAALLANKPAFIYHDKPLSYHYLAAILLLLPRDIAAFRNIAGWVPSLRINRQQLADNWSLLTLANDYKQAIPIPDEVKKQTAEALAPLSDSSSLYNSWLEDLVNGLVTEKTASSQHEKQSFVPIIHQTPFKPGLLIALTPLSNDIARKNPALIPLFRFAQEVDRRVLSLDNLALSELSDEAKTFIKCWAEEVELQKPAYVDTDQWQMKVKLLLKAAGS